MGITRSEPWMSEQMCWLRVRRFLGYQTLVARYPIFNLQFSVGSFMDILSQYKQDNPEAFREKPAYQPSKEYGFFVRLVMRASGGKISDINQAIRLLLILVVVVVIISLWLFFRTQSGIAQPSQELINRPQPSGVFTPR